MQVQCPHCRETIEFTDKRPGFCSYCGKPLADSGLHQAATLIRPASDPGTKEFVPGDSAVGDSDRPAGGVVRNGAGQAGTLDWSMTADAAGQHVAGYRLVRLLGQGGMGVVWEAEHVESGRRVALKLLSAGTGHSSEAMDRFVREGRLAAAFSHPRSTFVFEAGEHARQPFITMELMPGRTLHDVCNQEGPLPTNRAVDYILDVIDGLAAAHAAGVIHRDVKPSNCFIDSDGRVKVGDFGLSKSLVADVALTRTGAFMGTPLFAAPEQVRAGRVDERTDIYSVGATLFYLIARRGPFAGDPAAVIAQIASDPAPPIQSIIPTVPKGLDGVIARTLEKDPDNRFANLGELREALRSFATGAMVPAPLGHRLGAYFVDTTMNGFVAGLVTAICFMILTSMAALSGSDTAMKVTMRGIQVPSSSITVSWLVVSQLCFSLVMIGYYGISEGLWGKSVGKRLLGLRVVSLDGDRPGFGRCLVRATLVPGLMWVSFAVLVPFLLPNLEEVTVRFSPVRMLAQQAMGPLAFVPMLACLATMRATNGFRGAHELLTGTRVVVLRAMGGESRSIDVPIFAAAEVLPVQTALGPFQVIGTVGRVGNTAIYQARDGTLGRRVWVGASSDEASRAAVARSAVTRPARQRWLQSAFSDGVRWDAWEAVRGAPLSCFVQHRQITWEYARLLLLDLAEELAAATNDGTLPAMLTAEQVWVDSQGRIKLLDQAIEPASSNGSAAGARPVSASLSPIGLIREVTRQLTQQQFLPVHAQDFLTDLDLRDDDAADLEAVRDQLRELTARNASLNWSDRMVAIGASMGVEYPAYQVVLSLFSLAVLSIPNLPFLPQFLLPTGFALLLPAVVGYYTTGGPIFRFIGISVRRSRTEAAGRVRCGVRNFFAWAPRMFMIGISFALMPALMSGSGGQPENFTAGSSDPTRNVMLGAIGVMSATLSLIISLAAIYSVIRPSRGLQDILAGTRLVPD